MVRGAGKRERDLSRNVASLLAQVCVDVGRRTCGNEGASIAALTNMNRTRNAQGRRPPPSSRSGSETATATRTARTRPDDGNAFVPDPSGQLLPLRADDAESFAEEFVASATGGESVREDAMDQVVDDEEGGPFIVLDERAQLPKLPEERLAESDGHDDVEQAEIRRGARWAARRG